MTLRRTYRRCEALVRALEMPAPFDMRALCRNVSKRTGRPIRLEPVSLPSDGPCGLWICAATADYIFFEKQTSLLHQEHIIAHELGHLLRDHGRTSSGSHDMLQV